MSTPTPQQPSWTATVMVAISFAALVVILGFIYLGRVPA